MEYTVKHLCSYCGGWDQKKEVSVEEAFTISGEHTRVTLKIDMPDLGIHKDICVKCMVKVYDLVLGKTE